MTSASSLTRMLSALAVAAALAGCNETKNPGYQGWAVAIPGEHTIAIRVEDDFANVSVEKAVVR